MLGFRRTGFEAFTSFPSRLCAHPSEAASPERYGKRYRELFLHRSFRWTV